MTSFTVTLKDESTLKKAAKIAELKNTSVDDLIAGFLVSLSAGDAEGTLGDRSRLVDELQGSFKTLSRPLGGKGYVSRDELYER